MSNEREYYAIILCSLFVSSVRDPYDQVINVMIVVYRKENNKVRRSFKKMFASTFSMSSTFALYSEKFKGFPSQFLCWMHMSCSLIKWEISGLSWFPVNHSLSETAQFHLLSRFFLKLFTSSHFTKRYRKSCFS